MQRKHVHLTVNRQVCKRCCITSEAAGHVEGGQPQRVPPGGGPKPVEDGHRKAGVPRPPWWRRGLLVRHCGLLVRRRGLLVRRCGLLARRRGEPARRCGRLPGCCGPLVRRCGCGYGWCCGCACVHLPPWLLLLSALRQVVLLWLLPGPLLPLLLALRLTPLLMLLLLPLPGPEPLQPA